MSKWQGVVCAIAMVGGLLSAAQGQPVSVWTQHNNNMRLGNNNRETILTPANVKSKFGKLFSYTLDDQSYSQPLYIPQLKMSDGQLHNVVFVTTVNNTVYAWDADSNTAHGGMPLWMRNLTPKGATVPDRQYMTDQGACFPEFKDFAGKYGMVGTPVIDTTTNTLYVVAHVLEGSANVQRLHALDITNGIDKFGGSTVIKANYLRTDFDPKLNNQRPALTLANDVVYIGWSSYCDFQGAGTYHGWIIGYNAGDLTQAPFAVWNTTATNFGTQGGLWQSGQGLMIDSTNNFFIMTGNGTWNSAGDFGMSAVKLSPKLVVSSFFTPCNYQSLNNRDLDIGSSGMMPLPGTPYIAGGGKEGMFYLMDSRDLSGLHCPDRVLQEFLAVSPSPGTATKHIHGSPIYFNTGSEHYVYLWGENDFLKVFQFFRDPAHFDSTPVAASTMRAPQVLDESTKVTGGMPGGFMSLSADGAANAIIWALAPYACNANQHVEPGILYAFNASQFGSSQPEETRQLVKLWDSKQVASDDVGYYAKFTYPTIANGKVYVVGWGAVPPGELDKCAPDTVPSNQGQLTVYGLK